MVEETSRLEERKKRKGNAYFYLCLIYAGKRKSGGNFFIYGF